MGKSCLAPVGKSFVAFTVKRNSLAGAEVLHVGVNLATNQKQGGSDRPLDSTPSLDGQNNADAGMAGGSMFSSQCDFKLACVRLDRKRTITAAFEPIRTGKHIMHQRVSFGHESILLQNAKHIQIGDTNQSS